MFFEINNFFAKFFNNFVINNDLEKIIGFFADAPIFFLPIFLLITWFFYTYKIKNNDKKSDLLNIVYSIIFAIIINLIIQNIIYLDRPESVITPILKHIPDASFPSDHASVSFAFLTGLFLAGYKKTGYIFSIFVIIMNFSRIAGGIHWFFDVIAGACIGILTSIFTFKYLKNTKIIINLNNFIIKIMNYIKL